jgi:hypothetical protein
MPLPSAIRKPLLLIFPIAHYSNYKRCLLIANQIREMFDIQFLHSDEFAPLVYQQGYETFYKHFFSWSSEHDRDIKSKDDNSNLELSFLEQVEILETLQPLLVISDGLTTLRMATEFTGIPLIALLNGYQSPYYAGAKSCQLQLGANEPYRLLRDKYGLHFRQSIVEELEGDLNWICDLPDLFPQKELPESFELIGPLFEIEKPIRQSNSSHLNPLKKTIFIAIDDEEEQEKFIDELDKVCNRRYNVVTDTSQKPSLKYQKIKSFSSDNISLKSQTPDLIICSSQCVVYKALYYGIPVLMTSRTIHDQYIIHILEQWQLGSLWSANNSLDKLEYCINLKQSDTYRMLQYKLKETIASLGNKLRHSITIHFPFIQKATIYHH